MSNKDTVRVTITLEGDPDTVTRLAAMLRKEDGLSYTGPNATLVSFFRDVLKNKPTITDEELLEQVRVAIAQAAVELANGNITQAAKRLGMSRFGLQKRFGSGKRKEI